MNIDLHTHTTASDGALSPLELLARARDNDVQTLAITDHDTVAGFDALVDADKSGINLVTGIELSARWSNMEVHVVGLNIDLLSDVIHKAVSSQSLARTQRAGHIAHKLQQAGLDDPLPCVKELAAGATIGRPHFAQHLVNTGHVKDAQQAFKKYLGGNKLGNLKRFWPDISQVIGWIVDAGGTPVLAHPAHYKLTHTKLRELVSDFVAARGIAIEVISGRQLQTVTRRMEELANGYGLLASCGSDFHRPGPHRADVGGCASLSDNCRPVWHRW